MIKKNIDSYGQKNGSSHREDSRTRVFRQKATGVLMTGLIAGALFSSLRHEERRRDKSSIRYETGPTAYCD